MAEPNLFEREGIWWLRAKVNGHRYRESMRTADLREARKFREKRLKEIRSAWHGEATLWKGAVVAWVRHSEGQLSASTRKRYKTSIALVTPLIDGDNALTVDRIDGRMIARLIQERRESGASAATVRRDLTAISAVLTHAEAMGWSEGNPTLSKRRLLRERRDPIMLPTEESYGAVLEAASPELRALIVGARLSGCRQNELVTVKWTQFDAAAKTLEVIGKGRKRRTLKLSSEAAAHIGDLARNSDLIFCWPQREPGGKTHWLPFAQAASDFTHVRRAAEARAKREDRPFVRFRFHDLRHLHAVEALRGGIGIYRLSAHLGHTSVKTTEIYLAFLTPEEAERAKLA
jgi:integrase/recombinase XerD